MVPKPWFPSRSVQHVQMLLDSYLHWTGEELIPREDPESDSQKVFEAPFVVVSHSKEADPVLNYGNLEALKLWEMTWDSFIKTPSRLTAEIINREERFRLLEDVEKKGFSNDYRGIRISSTGRRFEIQQAVVWNLRDAAGQYAGQAATFKKWTYL